MKKQFNIPEYHGETSRRIRLLVKENPKKKNSLAAKRFGLYRDGMTIAEYVRACDQLVGTNYALIDITWDVNHKFIELFD